MCQHIYKGYCNSRQMGAKAPNLQYAVPVSQKTDGGSAIYRCPAFKDQPLANSTKDGFHDMKSALLSSLKKRSQANCLGRIIRKQEQGNVVEQIQYLKYEQVLQNAIHLGSEIINRELYYQPEGQKMKFIGIFSKNRTEWTITDVACILFNIVIIPIYDNLTDQKVSQVFNHTDLTTVFVTSESIKALHKTKDMANVKTLVNFDPLLQEDKTYFKSINIKLLSYYQLVESGQSSKVDYNDEKFKPNPKDCITFSYTSGTTGDPKAAMLSHENFVSQMGSLEHHHSVTFNQNDVSLSYLPLPNVLERLVIYSILFTGGKVVYSTGDITKLKNDIALVRPTIFISAPRLFIRFYDALNQKFNNLTGYTKSALDHGIKIKMKNATTNGGYTHKVYDLAFFNKTKAALGGRVRLMISGSTPLRPEVHAFMKAAMCCPFLQAYGQSQSTGGSFLTHSNDPKVGHVGGPVAGIQYKIVDLTQMNYTSEDKDDLGRPYPRGQVYFRGPAVFLGYYKNKEKTSQTLTQDGWLRSGDVGAILPQTNALKIIDRKHNIFKLQQGEYVAAEKVEAVYATLPLVSQIWLHGESTQNYAIAIVIPERKELQNLAKELQIEGNYEQLCRNKSLKIKVLTQMNKIANKSGLKSFQQAKNICLQSNTFLEKQILTNTMKLRRHIAKRVYAQQIKDLYYEGMLLIHKQDK